MFYYTMHSPRGAGASFVIGAENEAGGFQQTQGFIPENEVYIGVLKGSRLQCLPFFKNEDAPDAEENFDIGNTQTRRVKLGKYKKDQITRSLKPASDSWQTADFTFTLFTPGGGLPDPDTAAQGAVKLAVAPFIVAEFTVTNTQQEEITGFFGAQGLKGLYPLSQASGGTMLGAAGMDGYGFAFPAQEGAFEIADFSPASAFSRTERGFYQNCEMGGFGFSVKPGQTRTLRFVLGWFRGGIQTRGGESMPYFYTEFFSSLEEVLSYGLRHGEERVKEAGLLDVSALTPERAFFFSQALHCYWASTMLFSKNGKPRYVVNEGSYMMMNTFDLSVDHLFFECFTQPWTVKNQLDSFREKYTYTDTLHRVGEAGGFPGGISFTHDQGSYTTFTPGGYSCYEMKNKEGCLSYMSQEQLLNWLLSAAVYAEQSGDSAWVCKIQDTVAQCLDSMLNRDDPLPQNRDGVMDWDGDRCGKEGEITTYDSLDEGLGQARRNLYLAVKSWAGYLAIARLSADTQVKTTAKAAAQRCANTIAAAFDPNLGFIPAILNGKSQTAIIPAIEALVYPQFFGREEALSETGPYAPLIKALQKHLRGVLKPGLCIFDDGGWRLSSGSMNTWMSKIFLCEYVAESILGFDLHNSCGHPDAAQIHWWQEQCARCPGIDQVLWGAPYSGGFHYPRAITSALWAKESLREHL